jgi:hypothetical protein
MSFDKFPHCSGRGSDHRHTIPYCLENRDPEPLMLREADERVGLHIKALEFGVLDLIGHFEVDI